MVMLVTAGAAVPAVLPVRELLLTVLHALAQRQHHQLPLCAGKPAWLKAAYWMADDTLPVGPAGCQVAHPCCTQVLLVAAASCYLAGIYMPPLLSNLSVTQYAYRFGPSCSTLHTKLFKQRTPLNTSSRLCMTCGQACTSHQCRQPRPTPTHNQQHRCVLTPVRRQPRSTPARGGAHPGFLLRVRISPWLIVRVTLRTEYP